MSRSEPNFVKMTEDAAQRSVEQLRRQALRLLQQSSEEAIPGQGAANYPGSVRPDASPPFAQTPARAMMIGFVTMPAVFIVVVMGALALFGKPATQTEPLSQYAAVETLKQPAPAATASLAAAPAAGERQHTIPLGEDERIADLSLNGDRVALYVESPMGRQILIYDFAVGRVVAEAPIQTE